MEMTYQQAMRLNHKNALKAMERAVITVEADAKQLCPVDTGATKRSITHEVEDNPNEIAGYVGAGTEYAYWAEKNQPFLEPAVDQNLSQIKRMFEEELQKVK
ncbi:hypothetical protein [Caproiciproducens sp. CPB-2]|uniref:hypothetical protein n=1 Tax=Caproiciproducens sp. CPB-2 TaxID=3030017 RepID=UPI0023DA350E|nr:hypothetical protein [Caproiciproducens sp. CPB-2]MDF1496338.1 hypothetical protein [Caproiciproducens sp. CPB-2]